MRIIRKGARKGISDFYKKETIETFTGRRRRSSERRTEVKESNNVREEKNHYVIMEKAREQ